MREDLIFDNVRARASIKGEEDRFFFFFWCVCSPFQGSTCSSKVKKKGRRSEEEESKLENYPNSSFVYVGVRKNPNSPYLLFLVGLRLFLWYFWLFWKCLWLKTKKCKKRCIGFKGFSVKSFPKTLVLCFGHNMAYKSLNWMILIVDGA